MTRQNATKVILARDPLPVTLEPTEALVNSKLGEHTDQADLSILRGSAWPCERIMLVGTASQSDMTPQTGRTGDAATPTPVASPATSDTP